MINLSIPDYSSIDKMSNSKATLIVAIELAQLTDKIQLKDHNLPNIIKYRL